MLCWIFILGGLLIMMGQHDRSEALFYYFRLEDQVPENHLLRLIDKHVSFEFVRKRLRTSYSDTGRPSIDPELLLRILLIGYLYGITSERKLVEELRMHLAWRWFTGLGFDQEIPHHSTFSKKREKRACRSCEELGGVSAPLPLRIIEKCLASDRIVIDTVMRNHCNHTPLYRQSVILERDIGLEISRATLDGWVLKVGELLIPMVAAMRRELISGTYIQADETPVDVQTREGRGKNHQAYLWQYSRPGGPVVFDFRLGRGRDGPKRFLGQFEGILQTDGYSAYDQIGGPGMVHAACWAHARRQFYEAVQLNPRDPVATPIVARMDELFAVDAEARRKAFNVAVRHVRRQETARPLLDDIRSKIEAAQCVALPSSALNKACQYALTLWKKLTRFLEYPEPELSNNLAENSMRPVALGRKNWIHIGSPQAGPKVAAILSVVESCRRLKVPVRDYFSTILPGLADLPIRRLPDLTPAVWVARHS